MSARCRWLACCGHAGQEDVRRAVRSFGPSAGTEFVESPDDLRRAGKDEPGSYGAVVGEGVYGVSAVNLAAALAASGDFLQVVLVARSASGSLRSRAARAGIDVVVDPADLGERDLPAPVAGAVPAESGPAGGDSRSRPFCGTSSDPAPGVGIVPTPGPAPAVGAPAPAGAAPAPVVRQVVHRQVVPSPPAVKGRAPVVVFCSGRGGVGKTALVAACSAAGAAWGLRVAALDLDLSCGNLYSCFGLPEGLDLSGGGPEGPLDVASLRGAAACEGVRLFGPCSRPELAEKAMPQVEVLICAVSAAFDLVLVDTSTTFTDGVAQAIQLADRVLIVSDGAGGSTASCARVAGLAVRLGVARTRIARLENKVPARGQPAPLFPSAAVGLEGARMFTVLDGGDEARELLCAGRATELVEPGMPFGESAATLLAQVLAELGRLPEAEGASRALAAAAPRKRSFFGRRREARSA